MPVTLFVSMLRKARATVGTILAINVFSLEIWSKPTVAYDSSLYFTGAGTIIGDCSTRAIPKTYFRWLGSLIQRSEISLRICGLFLRRALLEAQLSTARSLLRLEISGERQAHSTTVAAA